MSGKHSQDFGDCLLPLVYVQDLLVPALGALHCLFFFAWNSFSRRPSGPRPARMSPRHVRLPWPPWFIISFFLLLEENPHKSRDLICLIFCSGMPSQGRPSVNKYWINKWMNEWLWQRRPNNKTFSHPSPLCPFVSAKPMCLEALCFLHISNSPGSH